MLNIFYVFLNNLNIKFSAQSHNPCLKMSSLSTLALHTPAPDESWAGGHQRHLVSPITVAATFELPSGDSIYL